MLRAPSVLAVVLALVSGIASAGAQDVAPTYRYDLVLDLSVTAGTSALGLGAVVFDDETAGPIVRDVDDVFVLDRRVARNAELRQGAATASDVLLASTVAFAGLATWFSPTSGPGHDRRERARRLGILVETLATANAFNTLVKLAARRPRPFTYAAGYEPDLGRLDDRLSFYSGHASMAASAIAAAAYFGLAGTNRRVLGITTASVGSAAALSVAFLRVRAGKHFPTDVAMGTILGSAIGVLVPHLHRRSSLSLAVEPTASGGIVTVSGLL